MFLKLTLGHAINNQTLFQSSASPIMEGIINLHHHIMFFLILIGFFVIWLVIFTLYIYTTSECFIKSRSNSYSEKTFQKLRYNLWVLRSEFLATKIILPLYITKYKWVEYICQFLIKTFLCFKINKESFEKYNDLTYSLKYKHGSLIEFLWTIIPCIILFCIAIPSYILLYSSDNNLTLHMIIKVIGHQWYWTYEYTSILNPIIDKNQNNKQQLDFIKELMLNSGSNINFKLKQDNIFSNVLLNKFKYHKYNLDNIVVNNNNNSFSTLKNLKCQQFINFLMLTPPTFNTNKITLLLKDILLNKNIDIYNNYNKNNEIKFTLQINNLVTEKIAKINKMKQILKTLDINFTQINKILAGYDDYLKFEKIILFVKNLNLIKPESKKIDDYLVSNSHWYKDLILNFEKNKNVINIQKIHNNIEQLLNLTSYENIQKIRNNIEQILNLNYYNHTNTNIKGFNKQDLLNIFNSDFFKIKNLHKNIMAANITNNLLDLDQLTKINKLIRTGLTDDQIYKILDIYKVHKFNENEKMLYINKKFNPIYFNFNNFYYNKDYMCKRSMQFLKDLIYNNKTIELQKTFPEIKTGNSFLFLNKEYQQQQQNKQEYLLFAKSLAQKEGLNFEKVQILKLNKYKALQILKQVDIKNNMNNILNELSSLSSNKYFEFEELKQYLSKIALIKNSSINKTFEQIKNLQQSTQEKFIILSIEEKNLNKSLSDITKKCNLISHIETYYTNTTFKFKNITNIKLNFFKFNYDLIQVNKYNNGILDFIIAEQNNTVIVNLNEITSYMKPITDLIPGELRLLEVTKVLRVPTHTHIHFIVTSVDVLHSWAIPSLGLKVDAVPGRLNEISVYITRSGYYYGQCSEICGVNHAFMPIVVVAYDPINK